MLHLGVAPLLLLVLGASLGAAFPRGALKKSCSLSKYQFLEPSELKAVQKMKEQFEDIMLLSERKCNSRLFHRKWSPAELSLHQHGDLEAESHRGFSKTLGVRVAYKHCPHPPGKGAGIRCHGIAREEAGGEVRTEAPSSL
nr:PREDICTED: interferon lambda-3-like [Opisthocomus hoazin]